MGQVFKLTTQTSQGEVTINLNLNITIHQDGSIQIRPEAKEEFPTRIIPNFTMDEMIGGFGNQTDK